MKGDTVVLRGPCDDCGKRTQQTVDKKDAGIVLGLLCRACGKKYKEAAPTESAKVK